MGYEPAGGRWSGDREGRALTGTSEEQLPEPAAAPSGPEPASRTGRTPSGARTGQPARRQASASELDVLTGALWVDGLPHADLGDAADSGSRPARFADPVSQWLRNNEAAGSEFIETRAEELVHGFTVLDVELVPAGQLAPLRAHCEALARSARTDPGGGERRTGPLAAHNEPAARAVLLGLCPFVSNLCHRQLVPSHVSSALGPDDAEPPPHGDGRPGTVTLLLCLSGHSGEHRSASHLLFGTRGRAAVVRVRAGRGAVLRAPQIPWARLDQGGPDPLSVLLLHYTVQSSAHDGRSRHHGQLSKA